MNILNHVYDLGNYKFNESDDIDLLKYYEQSDEESQYVANLKKIAKSTDFRMSGTSSVPEVYQPEIVPMNMPIAFCSPKESTRHFIAGLKETIVKVNRKLCDLSVNSSYELEMKNFAVTEYAKILTAVPKNFLYIPVEVNNSVNINDDEFNICINFDNPTSLSVGNQNKGCQGSHFGYTIITKSSGNRARGHVLITTFIGFPSRNETEKAKISREMKSSSKCLSFVSLCNVAREGKKLPFDISTGLGCATDKAKLHHSDRTKSLPYNLKALQNVFHESQFKLPDLSDIKLKSYFTKPEQN